MFVLACFSSVVAVRSFFDTRTFDPWIETDRHPRIFTDQNIAPHRTFAFEQRMVKNLLSGLRTRHQLVPVLTGRGGVPVIPLTRRDVEDVTTDSPYNSSPERRTGCNG